MALALTAAGRAVDAWSPLSLAPALWLDASAIAGHVDGDAIAAVTDSSGNSRSFTQPTVLKQPIYKTNIIGGKPVLRFDGVNSQLLANFGGFAFTTTLSLFLVYNPLLGSNYGTIVADTSHGVFHRETLRKLDYTTTVDNYATSAPADGTARIYSLVANAGALSFFLNGAADGTATIANGFTPSFIGDDGQGDKYKGDIAEIIGFTGALSTANRRSVEAYASSKYGIAVI